MNMCLNLNTCSNSLIDCNDYFTQFLRWQFIARGRAMREKDYIVIIGSANIDVAGYSHHPLNYADSNPGKIKFTPGGVGRNIAHNLALLGKNAWLLSAVGGDFYGQSLLAQTNQSGVYVDKCLIVPGENTSSYLSLLDNTGCLLYTSPSPRDCS